MKVVVIVPEEYMGDVIGDLNSRRGQIQVMEATPGARQITAKFRCLRCSVTQPICVPRLRAAVSTPWSPATTLKFRSLFLRQIIASRKKAE